LALYSEAKYTGDTTQYQAISSASQASNTALVLDDYDQVGASNLHLENGYKRNAEIPTTAYTMFSLSTTSGIAQVNPAGWSKFSVRERYDIENTTTGLTGSESGVFWWMNEKGAGYQPYLYIEYTAGGGVTPAPAPISDTTIWNYTRIMNQVIIR
jgi:hypothetical protein